MAPPKLPADAPILQIGHPMIVDLGPAFWKKTHLTALHDFARRIGNWILHEPLLGKPRFDRHIGALAVTDVVFVRLLLFQRAEFFESLHRDFARLETIQAIKFLARQTVHRAVSIDDLNRSQLMALSDFKVGFVMAGRDFQYAGA